MIVLNKGSRQARFFLWCLKNPLATGDYEKEDGTHESRKPEWYIENGTTLCHFFWACLWLPLIGAAILSLFLMLIIHMHVEAYDKFGTPGLFIPSGCLVGFVLIIGAMILAIIGAGKVGLLAYLKALKEKICPRMTFVENQNNTTHQPDAA